MRTSRIRRKPRSSVDRSRWIALLGTVAGICWCGVGVGDWLLFPFLVHVAIQGIGCAEPSWLSIEGFGLISIAKMRAFFWCSLLGVGGVLGLLVASWGVQVLLVLIGHVYALWIADRITRRLFENGRRAFWGQVPMLLAMIAFSIVSLWLLMQPMEMRISAM